MKINLLELKVLRMKIILINLKFNLYQQAIMLNLQKILTILNKQNKINAKL